MKKALILTVWDAPNYGSFLQATAMKKYLEQKDYEVSFIKYRTNIEEKKFLFEKKKQFLFHPIFSIKRANEFIKEHKKVKKVELKDVKANDYDLVVIGSDELWNLKNDQFFSNEYFYGGGFVKDKVLVYSISVGTGKISDFQAKPNLIENIQQLKDRIAVRDQNTYELVNEINADSNIPMTCDPTFLVDKEKYNEVYTGQLPEKFIVVYSYRICENLKNNIIQFAQKNDLKIVSLCNYYDFCDYNICCSPLEFSDIINKAAYSVITTFHGTIFSIFNHKQFVSVTNKPKTIDLLKKLNILDRAIDENCDYEIFENAINKDIDYITVDKNILKMRQESIKWLDNQLDD